MLQLVINKFFIRNILYASKTRRSPTTVFTYLYQTQRIMRTYNFNVLLCIENSGIYKFITYSLDYKTKRKEQHQPQFKTIKTITKKVIFSSLKIAKLSEKKR